MSIKRQGTHYHTKYGARCVVTPTVAISLSVMFRVINMLGFTLQKLFMSINILIINHFAQSFRNMFSSQYAFSITFYIQF